MRCKTFILLIFLFPFVSLTAQVPEYNRHISRSFPVSDAITVEIANKYGRVQVLPWDEDSVKFGIDLRIRAKDKQKLEKMKQSIEFEFTNGKYFLVAKTKFGEGGSDVIKDLVDIAGSYLSSSNAVTINYTVYVPSTASLKIENKFGDVYFEDHSGTLSLILSYGNLKANRLTGRSDIKITSGDGEIGSMKEGIVVVSYSDIRIHDAGKITAQTQASVVTIDKITNLKMNSRRDKVYLNEISYLTGESYFSDINVGLLRNDITLNARYGDIIIEDIQRSFSAINISSELTDVTLSFERPLIFGFELTHHQSVAFTYPTTLGRLSTKVINEEEKLFSTTGSFGSGSSDARVVIKAPRKCNLIISQK